ncbi:MAG: glycoside hydrolase family 18 protein [Chloroflexota bacterium]
MAGHGRALLSAALAFLLVALVGAAPVAARPGRVALGYVMGTDLYDGYLPKDIPVAAYSHLAYAFIRPTATGRCALGDPWSDVQAPVAAVDSVDGKADRATDPAPRLFGFLGQLRKLKAAHPGLRIIASIGGWSWSDFFSDIARTPASRAAFARSCIDLLIRGNVPNGEGVGGRGAAAGLFDGLDIDWEYPVCCGEPGNHERAADRANATLLLRELRRQLDAIGARRGRHYSLTIAIPGGGGAAKHYELAKVAGVVDWINLMSYDLHGSWDPTTDFGSPFHSDPVDPAGSAGASVRGSVADLRRHGVPAERIVVGVPFYGRQHIRVATEGDGLYQPYDDTGLSEGPWPDTLTPTWRDLVEAGVVTVPSDGSDPHGANGFTRHWSDAAGEPWLWTSAASRAGTTTTAWIGYTDPAAIAERVAFVRDRGLRGLMVWEVSQDDLAGTLGTALGAVRH